ncbi:MULTISPECIES: four helix bundle protein [Pirellulaceae]|uniref:Four helix bundle protein n=1 Tax=Aporhodopirellula rubra TaxID=980271 RepID=A0A7W5DU34_9BACT|nr:MULTISPECIES: four helix bundle protein [Pirellulaceae]EMI42569.1 S23 ribosomal protein [Rhodopirellula sp. SWK7]MBB3204584.1 four helix bundle protein [Aporhodopirellula rubra]
MRQFDHEKLIVYQRAIEFVAWASNLLDNVPRKYAANDQLDRASTSIPLNIAEGNGKFTAKDRCRFFDIARGSTLESAACLDVLVAKNLIERDVALEGKQMLLDTVSMLIGLIRANDSEREV